MGACVSILIRHDFYDLDNPSKSRQFVKQTIDRINSGLGIEIPQDETVPHGVYSEEDKWIDIGFIIPAYDVDILLRKGYWQIGVGCHYCQVVRKLKGRLYISDLAFKLAILFGQNEAWYCDEYLTDDCMMMTLDELIEVGTKQYGLSEFPYAELMKLENVVFPEYKPFYHDSFGQRNE